MATTTYRFTPTLDPTRIASELGISAKSVKVTRESDGTVTVEVPSALSSTNRAKLATLVAKSIAE